MNLNKILIIALFDLRHATFRLKGLVFIIPFLFFWYLVFRFLFNNGGELLVSAESILFFTWLLRADIAQKLLILHPPTLSVFFIVTLATIPFFAMLSGSNQTAGDIGKQTFRYFLTRCTRAEIFSGRLLGQYLILTVGNVFTILVAIVISSTNDQFSITEIIRYGLHIFFLIQIYFLPFVAYMSLISALMSSALSSLLMSFTVYTLLLIIGAYISQSISFDISLVPGGIKEYLYNIDPGDLFQGIAGLSGYSLIYLSLGWLIFRGRNI